MEATQAFAKQTKLAKPLRKKCPKQTNEIEIEKPLQDGNLGENKMENEIEQAPKSKEDFLSTFHVLKIENKLVNSFLDTLRQAKSKA